VHRIIAEDTDRLQEWLSRLTHQHVIWDAGLLSGAKDSSTSSTFPSILLTTSSLLTTSQFGFDIPF